MEILTINSFRLKAKERLPSGDRKAMYGKVTDSAISRFCNGKVDTRISVLQKIADFYGYEVVLKSKSK